MSARPLVDPGELLDVDSTQTVRAITPTELRNSTAPKWYVVQLVTSDRPINLDMMPRLALFAAHHLYTAADGQNDVKQYALRLGFFSNEQAADVVCGYVKTLFASPSIVRVSAAEQARFAQPKVSQASEEKLVPPAVAATKPNIASAASPPSVKPAVLPAAAGRKPLIKSSAKPSGSQKVVKRTKTLGEQLLDEAREVARGGKHEDPARRSSWITRLFGESNR